MTIGCLHVDDAACFQVIFSDSLWNRLKLWGSFCHAPALPLNPKYFKDRWLNEWTIEWWHHLKWTPPTHIKVHSPLIQPALILSPLVTGKQDVGSHPSSFRPSRGWTRSDMDDRSHQHPNFLILWHDMPLGDLATRVVADLPPVLPGSTCRRCAQHKAPNDGVGAAWVAYVWVHQQ